MKSLCIVASVLVLSFVNARAAQKTSTPDAPTGPMKPLASALHVLQPLSEVPENIIPRQSTAIRTFELSIHDFVTVSINGGPGGSNVVAAFTTAPARDRPASACRITRIMWVGSPPKSRSAAVTVSCSQSPVCDWM